jgi:putative transcriptional regulator
VGVETAIATTDIEEGETVSLTMREGTLHAIAGETNSATAVAVTDATAGQDVGVTNFEGVIDYDLGTVTVISVPPVQDGGSAAVDTEQVADLAGDHDLVAVDTPEGLAAARGADVTPDIRFGTAAAVQEAATKGLDVLLLVANTKLSTHTDSFREHNISYEVI